jgi:transcriptional regulator with XRE-family HTH domain
MDTKKNNYRKSIGRKIRIIRVLAGLSQDEFGASLSWSGSAISHVEAGRRGMDARRMSLVEKIYNVPKVALVSGIEMDAEDITALQNLMTLIKQKVAGSPNQHLPSIFSLLQAANSQV